MNESSRRFPTVEGLHNLRDVGGYRAGDQLVRWRTLFRSDALHRLTERGQQQFAELGITTILDLRDDTERAYAPTSIASPVHIVPSPIFDSVDHILRDSSLEMEDFYLGIVETNGQNLARTIRYIASNEQPATLVHCTAGKDRTGATIALTLTALGVDSDDILHDYAVTERMLAGEWADRHLAFMEQLDIALTPKMRRLLVRSPVEVIDVTLNRVVSQHGSVPDYLLSHGFSEQDLENLARNLLTSTESGDG